MGHLIVNDPDVARLIFLFVANRIITFFAVNRIVSAAVALTFAAEQRLIAD